MFKGTAGSQIIAIIGTLYLAQLYGSESYGIFGVFLSISGFLSVFNTIQLENGIITTTDNKEANRLSVLLWFIIFVISILIFLIYTIIEYYFNLSSLNTNLVNFSILAGAILSLNKLYEFVLTRNKKFRIIANVKIYLALLNIIFQFILFKIDNIMGLIYGNSIALTFVLLFYLFKNKIELRIYNEIKLNTFFKNYKSILKYLYPSALINNAAMTALPILILTLFSAKDAGVYSLSLKIVATPLFLISSSISQVYYKKSSDLFYTSKEKLFDFTKNIVLANLGTMLIILIFINTLGIFILEYFFTKNWENLRLFTLLLSVLIFARTSFNPISNIAIVMDKNKVSLLFNIYLLLVNIVAVIIGFFYDNLFVTIIILSFFGALGYFFLLFYFLRLLKNIKLDFEILNNKKMFTH
jgi:O-antigen/teichoic acid export membrane protein